MNAEDIHLKPPHTLEPIARYRFMALLLGIVAIAAAAAAQPCGDWQRVALGGPAHRFQHAMAYDSVRGVTVLFGGYDGGRFGDTWEWDGAQWRQVATTGPRARMNHTMVFDSTRGVTVLFGGSTGPSGGLGGDTWEWDGLAWTQVSDGGPAAREAHAMVYDAARGVCVLYGGESGRGLMSDTWEWNGQQWVLVADQSPSARRHAAMAYDSERGVTVMFGGETAISRRRDTWEWDGARWSLVANGVPSARSRAAMAYDSTWGLTVMHGGADSNGFEEVWMWDGSAWEQLLGALVPQRRSDHAAVYDAARRAIVLFGGQNSGQFNDTWEWRSHWWFAQQPSDLVLRPGADAEFRVEMGGSPGLEYQWRRDGQALTDGGRISGATTPALLIRDVRIEDIAAYDCVVSEGRCGRPSDEARLFVIDLLLLVDPTCPNGGAITIAWERATPEAEVALLFAQSTGAIIIPSHQPCAGTVLGLGASQLQVAWQGHSGAEGRRTIHGSAGPRACGGYFQLLDLASCATSAAVRIE